MGAIVITEQASSKNTNCNAVIGQRTMVTDKAGGLGSWSGNELSIVEEPMGDERVRFTVMGGWRPAKGC